MDIKTSLIVLAIVSLSWAFLSWHGAFVEKGKLQPLIDEERRSKLQLELRCQREEEAAAAKLAEAQERLKEATARCAQLEQQLAARQMELTRAKEQCDSLENDVSTTKQAGREMEIQHRATHTRVGDLEGSLAAERGRLGALQTALEARQDLVRQLSNELASTNTTMAGERTSADHRETALREQLGEHERILTSGSNQTEIIKAELEKAKKAQAAVEQESEAKAADWSRKLATSENKIQLLQKEILSLVHSGGGHGDAAGALVAAENLTRTQERAKTAEARVLELEEQLAQGDPAIRKKLRETEYRVCELEFKLAEADEAKTAAVAGVLAGPAGSLSSEQPSPEYLAKLHDELAATRAKCHDLTRERDEARSAIQGTATS